MEVIIKKGGLSLETADAYVLACSSDHFHFSDEMNEVDIAGSKGVRKFVDYRIAKRMSNKPLKQGDALCVDAFGGKVHKLVFIICYGPKKEVSQVKDSLSKGLSELFLYADVYNLKTVAMYPLCVGDKLASKDFVLAFKEALLTAKNDCCLEQVLIVVPEEKLQNCDVAELKKLIG